jgi:hypothetical protein
MATIKLTGFNTTTARQSVAGDGDTVDLQGSLTIGNNPDDTIIVNAEFDSDLIPDDTDTYDIGSVSKKWRNGYFEQVNAKLRHVNTAKYNNTSNSQQYVRWNTAGSNSSPGVNNKFVAPAAGNLLSVTIRSTSAMNGTNIAFHKASNSTANLNTTATETVGIDISAANSSFQANFSNSAFSAGDILGISINPTNTPNDVDITCVWLFDWNA